MKCGVKDTSFPQQTHRDKSSNSLLKKTHDWSFMVRIPELVTHYHVGMEEQHGRQNNTRTSVSSDKEEQWKQYYD